MLVSVSRTIFLRTALISCLRGGTSSFLEYIGLEAPLDVILSELTERYIKTAPTDTLVCKFHQLHQERNESVRSFAGRIEKLFKKLQEQIPEQYPDRLALKDRLFYGMSGDLRGSLRFLYTQEGVTYSQLLHEAHIAEIESSKGISVKAKGLLETPSKEIEVLHDKGSPVLAVVEDKLDKLTAIVKSVQDKKGQEVKKTPKKVKGYQNNMVNMLNAAKPLQCWTCGGWGHTSRECHTQDTTHWKELWDSYPQQKS